MNADGLVDSDYTGNSDKFELGVILFNSDVSVPIYINHHDRIAQIEIRKVVESKLVNEQDVDYDAIREAKGSNRTGGFGSTGK